MTKYFKIVTSYDDGRYVPITDRELQAAIHCFITDGKGVFKNGVVRGKDIISIEPDYHTAMGWNKGYNITPEDQNYINAECKDYKGLIADAKFIVENLIKSGQEHLIGTKEAEDLYGRKEIFEEERIKLFGTDIKLLDNFGKL